MRKAGSIPPFFVSGKSGKNSIFNELMDVLLLISILVAMCAVFSYINIRYIKLQSSIGLMLISLICSLLIIIESKISSTFHHYVEDMVRSIDFSQTLLNVMLGFLLFAGALHVNLQELKKQPS